MQVANQLVVNPFNTERFHGLDAARAIALFIGIFHHGIESFISYAKWDWITEDSQSSLLLDILFYVSHVFRMQAFFLMAGFFAHLLFIRKGYWGFVSNRTKRLLLPLLLFWPILYLTTFRLWVWGIQSLKNNSYAEALAELPDYMVLSKGFPFMHLWFLYFLILFCTSVVLIRPIVSRVDKSEKLGRAVDRLLVYALEKWWGSLFIGMFMVMPMLGMKDWFGVDTSASGFMPRIAPFILYGMYFTLGWFIYRQVKLLKNIEKFRSLNLLIGIFFIVLLIVLNLLLANPSPADAATILGVLNALYAFASITTVFAFIGYMMAHFSSPSARMRYFSDASYWGYLTHLPIIGFFQIMVASYDINWALKLILIFAPSIILVMVSYKYFVRNTALGFLLNGVKKAENRNATFKFIPDKNA